MTSYERDIADMKCWLVRMAQVQWGMPAGRITSLFKEQGVFSFISDCYDALHLSSYEQALKDVERYLDTRGVAIC